MKARASLEFPVYLRISEGKHLLPIMSVPTAVALEQVLTCCGLGPCCSAVVVLSIALHLTYVDHLKTSVGVCSLRLRRVGLPSEI